MSKVNKKIRKYVLGIEHTKSKRQGDIFADSNEMRFQFKVLIDRLMSREQIMSARSQKPAEIVSDLKDCWGVAHDYQEESRRYQQNISSLKQELAAAQEKLKTQTESNNSDLAQKEKVIA